VTQNSESMEVETGADAIWVSSLYGHGEIDCRSLGDKCVEAGISDIILYVGGNLVIGKRSWEGVRGLLLNMGYDRACPPGTGPQEAIADLWQDLKEERENKNAICSLN